MVYVRFFTRFILAGLFALSTVGCVRSDQDGSAELVLGSSPTGPFNAKLAIALTPPDYPQTTDQDLSTMFSRVSQVGAGVAILSWDDPDYRATAGVFTQWARDAGVTLILGLSPTAIERRDRLVVPAELADRFAGEPSFSVPAVSDVFIDAANYLAGLNPDYLCLGTEINYLAAGNPQEFLAFAEMYKQAYQGAKQVSPQTRVFVSLQWDVVYNAGEANGGFHPESAAVLNALRPYLDLLAFTSYPGSIWSRPADVPDDYYQSIEFYRQPGEPVVMMEIGWPSQGSGDPDEQSGFIRLIPDLFYGIDLEILGWSLLYDVPRDIMAVDLATTGLHHQDGAVKPSWQVFLDLQHDS